MVYNKTPSGTRRPLMWNSPLPPKGESHDKNLLIDRTDGSIRFTGASAKPAGSAGASRIRPSVEGFFERSESLFGEPWNCQKQFVRGNSTRDGNAAHLVAICFGHQNADPEVFEFGGSQPSAIYRLELCPAIFYFGAERESVCARSVRGRHLG